MYSYVIYFFFFFNDTATTEIYTLSLHDALPIFGGRSAEPCAAPRLAAGQAAADRPGSRRPVCHSPEQSVCNERRCSGDLGRGSAESVALRLRLPERPALHRGCRPEHLGGSGRGAGKPGPPELRLADHGGGALLQPGPVQLRWARAAGARVLPRGRLLRHRWVRVSRYSFPGARGPVLLLGLLPGLAAERQVREWGRLEPDALEPRRQPRKRVVLRTRRPWRAVRAVGERGRVPDRAIAVVDSPM